MADWPKQDRDIGLARTRSGGRFVTVYDPDIALQICEKIALGETLTQICKKGSGFPTRNTFYRWCVNQPELGRAYGQARELSAHNMDEEALDMARELKNNGSRMDSAHVRAYDVAMNHLRWTAARRNPRAYSERGAIKLTVPIQINTSLDLGGEAAMSGTMEHPDIFKLEAKMELPEDEDATKVTRIESAKSKAPEAQKPILLPAPERTKKPRKRKIPSADEMKTNRERYKEENGET